MSNNRVDDVVSAIVEGIRHALKEKNVTFDEYRAGIRHIFQTADAGELGLLIDLFFNTTICEIESKTSKASPTDLEGPYFIEDAPFVTDRIKTMEQFGGEPMLLRGTVKDTAGKPVEGATVFVWSSTPDGKYGGFHGNIPNDYYRGKLLTGKDGRYTVESTVPVPYQIKNDGPVGALLEAMGRHSWRPAHVHYKIRKPGFRELTTQAYFEGGEWVDDDCCEGNSSRAYVMPKVVEGGKRIVEIDFVVDRAA